MGDYIFRNHIAPRTNLHVPQDDFPKPFVFFGVQRLTKTSLDVLQEATIDNHWNMDSDESLSEPWIGRTRPQQDLETFGQKNGLTCQKKVHSVKPYMG